MPENDTHCCGHDHGCGHACDADHAHHHRSGWLSSRLGRAATKGVGCTALSAVILAPCPCCGGVIVACFRGLVSAGIGLAVGFFSYRRKPAVPAADPLAAAPDAALEPK